MRLLLDSNVLLWTTSEPEELREEALRAVEETENDVVFSAASIWELSIKQAGGGLKLPPDFVDALIERGYSPLAITVEHALTAGGLPTHHRDPFDRMLVAQAMLDDRVIVSRDRKLAAYDVALLPA
jgi:PIN domain nuclease of toxin-antitoxin system